MLKQIQFRGKKMEIKCACFNSDTKYTKGFSGRNYRYAMMAIQTRNGFERGASFSHEARRLTIGVHLRVVIDGGSAEDSLILQNLW
jgi:hypothetical protein